MFTVTDHAATAIRQIITRSGGPQGAGVRITADEDSGVLRISLSSAPAPGDTVFEAADDATLFIGDGAADLLEDKVIDAVTDESGRVQFVVDAPAQQDQRSDPHQVRRTPSFGQPRTTRRARPLDGRDSRPRPR